MIKLYHWSIFYGNFTRSSNGSGSHASYKGERLLQRGKLKVFEEMLEEIIQMALK